MLKGECIVKNKKKKIDLRKQRTKGTVMMVINELSDIDIDTIINSTYIKHETEFDRWLIKEFEKQLLLSKLNHKEFGEGLGSFFKEMASKLKKENKTQEFLDYCYKAYIKLDRPDINHHIAMAYYDLLIEQWVNLTSLGYYMVGLDTKGKQMTIKEIYPDTDRIMQEVLMEYKVKSSHNPTELLVKHFKRNGYNISGMEDVDRMFMEERIIVNMHFCMSFLIDEYYSEFLAKPYYMPQVNQIYFPKANIPTSSLYEQLMERRGFLPKQGVHVENIPDTNIQEVYVKEKFHLDRVFLLYRFKINNSYTVGYYDTNSHYFFSIWRDGTQEVAMLIHKLQENFVLEVYANLTTDINTMPNLKMSIVDDEVAVTHTERGRKTYSKKDYMGELRNFGFGTRKLPSGWSASEEAKELASKYGIKLRPDETFVREFTKLVKKKGEGR